MSSSGGTESELIVDGVRYRQHKFTTNGTLTISNTGYCHILVVGGGGGGGSTDGIGNY